MSSSTRLLLHYFCASVNTLCLNTFPNYFSYCRAWRISAIAIRSAVAMGLHLRNESEGIAFVSKESRYRLWWALHLLDILLCVMTGRPPNNPMLFCTTPLSVPYDEEEFCKTDVLPYVPVEQDRYTLIRSLLDHRSASEFDRSRLGPTSFAQSTTNLGQECGQPAVPLKGNVLPCDSMYFLYMVDLAIITQETVEALYSPGRGRRSSLDVEIAASFLNAAAERWLSRLPAVYDFTAIESKKSSDRRRIGLAFFFYSAKLLILQPCLHFTIYGAKEGESPSNSCTTMANTCVNIACQIIDLLPDEPDAGWLYRYSPWWSVIHNITQSTTVLMTHLFAQTYPSSIGNVDKAQRINKATKWLVVVSTRDPRAERVWSVLKDIVSSHGTGFGLDAYLDPQ